MKKIAVIHSGIQHVLQTCLAYQDIDALHSFTTSWVHMGGVTPFIPDKIRQLRDFSQLEKSKLFKLPFPEIMELIVKRLKSSEETKHLANNRDLRFVKSLEFERFCNADGLHIYPNQALELFEHFPMKLKIIEQPIGHISSAINIFSHEKNRNPDFAHSITYDNKPQSYINRINNELAIADKVSVPSAFVKDTLVENGVNPNKIVRIPYGSFIEPITNTRFNSGPIRLIYVGQLSQRKGIKYLFEALEKLRKRCDIHFTLVGQNFIEDSILSKYAKIITKYYPSLSRDELRGLLSDHDVFCLPSLFEGSALVVYEAMACGLVPIVTRNTGSDFIVDGQNGYVIPASDSDAIREKILSLDQDRQMLKLMKANALDSSSDLSWAKYHEKTQSFAI